MPTQQDLAAELDSLLQQLGSGDWLPTARERACAAYVLAGPDLPTAETLATAAHMCTPHTGCPLSPVLAGCVALIRSGQQDDQPGELPLQAILQSLLHAVRATPASTDEILELARGCLDETWYHYRDRRQPVPDADLAAARASGLVTPPATPAETAAEDAVLQQAELLVRAVPALRHAATLPSSGPLPLLITLVADLCDALREQVGPMDQPRNRLSEEGEARAHRSDLVRQLQEVNVLYFRLAAALGSLLARP
ncbi:hypothetical protein ACIO3O_39970 [Streptomyces sp. NPDC087440]|uniref:hypothetical protein n=1 Tax=Streptomyces sp. NPDC087440 TaxID=3365790 RepID=UPI0038096915